MTMKFFYLSKKFNQIKGYIDDIIEVMQELVPFTRIKSTKDLHLIAEEIRQTFVDIKSNIQYIDDDVTDSQSYVIMQVPVVAEGTKTVFNLKSNNNVSVSTSGGGTDVYNTVDKKITVTNKLLEINQRNDEGWNYFNIVVKGKSTFDIKLNNSNIIALRVNNVNHTDDFAMSNAFENNKKLRTVTMKNVHTELMVGTFRNCENLTYFEGDLSSVINLTSLFENCKSLQRCKIKLRNSLAEENNETITFDMFRGCTSLELLELDVDFSDREYKLPNLDLSDCCMTKDTLIELLNSLPYRGDTNDRTTIIVNVEFSKSQKDSFKAKGYNVSELIQLN